jgi:hypothetical protein
MANVGTYHVAGPALIQVGTSPVVGSSPLQALGYSEDGVDIAVHAYDEPITTDKSGPAVPEELQDFGMDAVVRCSLPMWDPKVMAFIRSRRSPAQNQEGVSPNRGGLIFAGGAGIRVVITSPNADEPWRFFFCTLRGPRGGKYGTRATRYDLTFYCLQREAPNLGPGFWLYDHVAA